MQLIDRPDRIPTLTVHPDDHADGWTLLTSGYPAALVNDHTALRLHRNDRPATVAASYRRPDTLDPDVADRILAVRPGRTSTLFDGPCVSTVALPGRRTTTAVLRQASYFDHMLTNNLGADIAVDHTGTVLDAADLWTDQSGAVLPLNQSTSAHTLGGCVLAVCADGHIVGSQRSSSNAAAAGRLDVTVSGGFIPPSAGSPTLFGAYAADNIIRELGEENGVAAEAVAAFHVIAAVRWLHRGGKPDLFAVARLHVDSAALTADDDVTACRPLGQAATLDDLQMLLRRTAAISGATPLWSVYAGILADPARFPAAHTLTCATLYGT